MALSKPAFSELFSKKAAELAGRKASAAEIEESYRDYVKMTELFPSDGRLIFRRNRDGSLVWEFEPVFETS